MSDQINNQNSESNGNSNSGNILKELSDIKTSLAVNTAETSNIKDTVNEVKNDVKEMKKNYITQEQHREVVKCTNDHEDRIRNNEKNITRIMTVGGISVFFLGILEFIIDKFLR